MLGADRSILYGTAENADILPNIPKRRRRKDEHGPVSSGDALLRLNLKAPTLLATHDVFKMNITIIKTLLFLLLLFQQSGPDWRNKFPRFLNAAAGNTLS